jgi:hypothetical protein
MQEAIKSEAPKNKHGVIQKKRKKKRQKIKWLKRMTVIDRPLHEHQKPKK